MNAADYPAYLGRLKNLVYLELVGKAAVFDYFTRHAGRGEDEDVLTAVPLLWFFQSGLLHDLTLSLSRLFETSSDPNSRNIRHFLATTERLLPQIPWTKPVSSATVMSHRRLLDGVRRETERLIARRNKFFAHYDGSFFDEPDAMEQRYPFTNDDAISLVRVLQKIVSDYHEALHGSRVISMEEVFYIHAERVYEQMRRANVT